MASLPNKLKLYELFVGGREVCGNFEKKGKN